MSKTPWPLGCCPLQERVLATLVAREDTGLPMATCPMIGYIIGTHRIVVHEAVERLRRKGMLQQAGPREQSLRSTHWGRYQLRLLGHDAEVVPVLNSQAYPVVSAKRLEPGLPRPGSSNPSEVR